MHPLSGSTSDTSVAYHNPQSSGDSHEKSSGDDVKWQKLCSAPAHKGLTPQPQNVTPPSATQLEVTSRCNNLPESWKSCSPSPTGGKDGGWDGWEMEKYARDTCPIPVIPV